MKIRLSEDILPISELKKNTVRVMDQLKNSNRPMVITINGKAEAVILSTKLFEKLVSEKVKTV
ncbi:MAG: type II toxin-antitoxin system Phd/YefM family antitoxin [Ignavibacteriaceae bacterium]|nr:type II toxin-antitoxin system Phd/YefM family antitoxin [Ignavibacteriaceae bacterium]